MYRDFEFLPVEKPPFDKGGQRGFFKSLNPPQSPFYKGGNFYHIFIEESKFLIFINSHLSGKIQVSFGFRISGFVIIFFFFFLLVRSTAE